MRSTPNHLAQLDPHVQAQRARDTIQRIRISSGENLTRIYSSASWSRATFTMQCSTTKKTNIVYSQQNKSLKQALLLCRTLLRESSTQPNRCKELVRAWPDYIGICNASLFGFGGVIVGENSKCPPTVVCLQWPEDITNNLKSDSNPNSTITNSDLEMAGLLLVFLIMEEIVCNLRKQNITLFSNNTPTVSWVKCL
jgi:hypothetical protein